MSIFTPPSTALLSFIGSGHVQYHDEWAQSTGDTAIIGKYKIVMAKADSYNKPLGCKTQAECGGTDSGTKTADGCAIYNIPASTAQATAACNSAHPYWNGASCEYCIGGNKYTLGGYPCTYSYSVPASTCGGMKTTFTRECAYSAKVYYNNVLIEDISTGSERLERAYLNGAISSTPELQVVFNNQHGFDNNVCRWIQNTIQIRPIENIEVKVATPQAQYFQGQRVNIDVQVINNVSNTLTGTLDVAYEIPTGLSNPSTQLDTKEISINSGVNTYSYTIPTTESTERIKITPSLKIYLPTTGLSGMSYDDGTGAKAITSYTKLPYGSVTETTHEVMILPSVNKTEYQNALEQAKMLNSSLQEKLDLIIQLSATLEDKGKALNALQLSIDSQSLMISQLTQKSNEQGVLVNQLQMNVNDKAALIASLTKNIEDQSFLIFELQNKEKAQAEIVNNLETSLANKAAIISQLTSENNKQGEIIANLNLNLQQKAQIISQLDITTAEQAELIKAMKLSFADQQTLVDSLGLKVSDSQALILALQGSVAEQTALSEKYKAEADNYAKQLNLLQGNVDQQAQIINSLNLKIVEQADLVSKLNLTLQQDAELIKKLNLNNQDQAKIIAALKLSNQEDKDLVAKLTADLVEQQRLLESIKAEKAKTSTPSWMYYAIGGMGIVTILALMLKKKKR